MRGGWDIPTRRVETFLVLAEVIGGGGSLGNLAVFAEQRVQSEMIRDCRLIEERGVFRDLLQ